LNIEPEDAVGYPHANTASQLADWIAAKSGDPAANNKVGMSLSFRQGSRGADGKWTFRTDPDWAAAELHFLLAARDGYWAAFHNLGVMYRNGLGVRLDENLAFYFFLRAAEMVEKIESEPSIRALGEVSDLGWGRSEDRSSADAILHTDLARRILAALPE
jgi:TPR repeat protein